MAFRGIRPLLITALLLQSALPPTAGASMVQPKNPAPLACLKHAYWLNKITSMKANNGRCQSQLDAVKRALADGYQICQELNPPKAAKEICEVGPAAKNYLSLRELSSYKDQQPARLQASEIVSQYKGFLEGFDKDEDSCLRELPGFRHDFTCKLSPEFGEKPAKPSWWSDFWNREQSEAPFQDIPPWLKTIASGAMGAFCWRARGGGIFADPENSHSTIRRLGAAACFTGIGWFNGGLDGAIAGLAMLPGMFVPYGEQMVMKNGVRGVDESGKFRNLAYMTGLGLATTAASSAYLYARGYDPTAMIAGGGAKGLCYFGSWNWAPNTFNSFDKEFVGGGATQTAELCSGATMGAGLAYSLNYGKTEKQENPKPKPENCDEDDGKK